jgi:hypothetical protein
MIREVFVVNDAGRVLFGDPCKYPASPAYPIHKCGDQELAQLRVNDVRLAVLHSHMDSFTALSYLGRLRKKLEKELRIITAANVLKSYFLLFEILRNTENVVFEEPSSSFIPQMLSSNAYVDVIESSNVVIEDGRILVNRIAGECYLSGAFDRTKGVRFVASKTESLEAYKSSGKMVERLDGLEVVLRSCAGDAEFLRYSVRSTAEPLIDIGRTKDGFDVRCRETTRFDYLEVSFQVPEMAAKVVKAAATGVLEYLEDSGTVVWSVKNEVFSSARITLKVELFEECREERPIVVKYYIKMAADPAVCIERGECLGNESVHLWIRYTKQSGRYEIRMS